MCRFRGSLWVVRLVAITICGTVSVAGAANSETTDGKSEESVFTTYVEKAKLWLGKHPLKYKKTASREISVVDGVVALESGKIQLGSVVRGLDPAEYFLKWRLIPDGDAANSAKESDPLPLAWNASGSPELPARTLSAGLYEVSLLERNDGKFRKIGPSFWMLACNPEKYAEADAAYKAAKARMLEGNNVNPELLRALLDVLPR